MRAISHLSASLIAFFMGPVSTAAQETSLDGTGDPAVANCEISPRVFIEPPIGSVRIGGETAGGERRYARRSVPSGGMLIVQFSQTPEIAIELSNDAPPPPDILAGRPRLQEAFDRQAQPGQFVSPPSIAS